MFYVGKYGEAVREPESSRKGQGTRVCQDGAGNLGAAGWGRVPGSSGKGDGWHQGTARGLRQVTKVPQEMKGNQSDMGKGQGTREV